MKTYTKEIPQTVNDFINTVSKECKMPRYVLNEFFDEGEIEGFINAETPQEKAEYLEAWTDDIKIFISFFENLKDKIQNWEE